MNTRVPRPPDTFIGRDHELALLERLLSRQHLVVIKGIGGIGKTALALSWTERLRATQPDAVVWFGRCTPQSGIDALFPQVASASPDETAAALIEAANAARALLVIDDLHLLAPDQAATLLRQLHTYLGGHAVITTREDLPLTALESVDIAQMKLEGLPSPAAASLLGDLLALHPGAPVPSPGSATALVEAVGGHPLFIRLMASLLVNRLADADALARGALPVGLREDLLEKVVGDVPPPERAVLEVLAVARAPLPDTALALLSGVPDASILRTALERRLLVERESPERILVHHLLADHVTASTTPQRRQALHLGLARWWREQGQSARSFHHFVEGNQLAAAADTLETVAPALCASAQHDLLLDGIRRLETGGQPPGTRARVAQANALSVLGRSVESLE
ncbi:MAG: hypothetical protein EB084_25385, partial [Proteobacteria bacterium]|nr:hypothetical protein [Pseudomonadota bacterium]